MPVARTASLWTAWPCVGGRLLRWRRSAPTTSGWPVTRVSTATGAPGTTTATRPPTPIKGRDALYSTLRNAAMARKFGLRCMVTTDHGGPNHANLSLEQAHRELNLSREFVPDVLQFYGIELNMSGMDHHTLIIPRAGEEAQVLYGTESRLYANEDWTRPLDPRRQSAALCRRRGRTYSIDRPSCSQSRPSRPEDIRHRRRAEPPGFRDSATGVYLGMKGRHGTHPCAQVHWQEQERQHGRPVLSCSRSNPSWLGEVPQDAARSPPDRWRWSRATGTRAADNRPLQSRGATSIV